MSLSRWGANHHLDVVYGAEPPVATFYIAAAFTSPGYLSTGSTLDEPDGGGYARVEVPNSHAGWTHAADGMKSNMADILFPTATEAWGTIRFWAICTAATDGEIVSYGTSPAQLVLEGTTLRFLQDQLRITMR